MLSPELEEKFNQYFDSEISIQDFRNWLNPRKRKFLSDPNSEDANFVAMFELEYADLNNDEQSEEELKSNLKAEIQSREAPDWINISDRPMPDVAGSSNITLEAKLFHGYKITIHPR